MPYYIVSCATVFASIIAAPTFALGDDPSPCTPATPAQAVGAWIEVDDDGDYDDHQFNYYSPSGPFQALITNKVYECVDILSICFIDTVRVGKDTVPSSTSGATGWTQQFTGGQHQLGKHQDGAPPFPYTNQDYFEWIVRDAKAAKQDMRITVTLLFGVNGACPLFQVFQDKNGDDVPVSEYPTVCKEFALNLIQFLDHYGINGIDIDWEAEITGMGTPRFTALFNAIGEQFKLAEQNDPTKDYILTISPASTTGLDSACADVINCHFYAVNFQLYHDSLLNESFSDLGVNENIFAYGACFESDSQCPPQQAPDAQGAYNDNRQNYNAPNGYSQYMMWRLNSSNWVFEQAQQKALYALVYPSPIGDIDGDGDFDADDLARGHELLGTDPADLNGDGCVNGADLGILLAAWSICP